MATARTIINMALRRIGRLGSGESATTQEYLDCAEYLRGIYNQTISSGAIGRLTEVVLDTPMDEYQALPNQHVIRASDDVGEISLPLFTGSDSCDNKDYGEERYGYSRKLANGSVVAITDIITGHTAYFIYDTTTMDWMDTDDLGLGDNPDAEDLENFLSLDVALSERDPVGLACRLAILLAEDFGSEVGATTQQLASIYQMNLALGYGRLATDDLCDRYRLD